MTVAPVRMAYVGAGTLAQRVHLPTFTALPACDVVALAEVRGDLGERVRARYGIPRLVPDHRALLDDPTIEAIGVSAAFALQPEIARECLAAGKHVFMEKPMAISLAQADRLLAAARTGGGRLMVAHMKRYDAGNELAHAVIARWRASGASGRPTLARAHAFGGDWVAGLDVPVETSSEPLPAAPTAANLPAWLPTARADGYVSFVQQYVHNLNLLRYLLDAGDDAAVRTVDLDADGYTGVTVLQVGGVRCVLESGRLAYQRWDEDTQVYFERGWVRTWAPPLLLRNTSAEIEVYQARAEGETDDPLAVDGARHTTTRTLGEPRWSWAYKREAEHFLACLRSGEPFRSSGEDTRTDIRLCEEIYRRWLNL